MPLYVPGIPGLGASYRALMMIAFGPVATTVAFTPSVAMTGSDANPGTGIRVVTTLASALKAQFRVTFSAGTQAEMQFDSVGFGKGATADASTAPLEPLEFGGASLPPSHTGGTITSDWMTTGLTFGAGDKMVIGFALSADNGGTAFSTGNSNVVSYYGSGAIVAEADPSGYTLSGTGNCFAVLLIETRDDPNA